MDLLYVDFLLMSEQKKKLKIFNIEHINVISKNNAPNNQKCLDDIHFIRMVTNRFFMWIIYDAANNFLCGSFMAQSAKMTAKKLYCEHQNGHKKIEIEENM